MNKLIIWSPLSETDLEVILEYLAEDWNGEVAIRFLDKIEHLLEQISINPEQFPMVNTKRKVRKCVITRHNTLFYRENKEYVEVLRIFDTRQDPKRLKYE
jgi:plasmid stabilization system protein ParE